jgi:hypothetical protein
MGLPVERMALAVAGFATVLLGHAAPARADYVTDSFGAQRCSRPGTMQVQSVQGLGAVLRFDLSAIPKGATVYRAVLEVSCRRRYYTEPVHFVPFVPGTDGKPKPGAKPLPLRPPFYRDIDATAWVRRCVAAPRANPGLQVASAPGWRRERTRLLVSYEGKARKTPAVRGIDAVYHGGQVFVRWREIEDVVAAEQVRFEAFEAKVLAAWARRHVVYRIYRHTEPITAKNIGAAALVRDVPEILPAYNLDAVPTTEFPGRLSRPSKLGIGGNRRLDVLVKRFVLPTQRQLTSGENLAVLTCRKDGSFYYAVTAVVDGYEAVASLGAPNSLARPIAEKVAPVAPLRQSRQLIERRGRRPQVYETYVCFYEPPYWPTPRRVEMCSTYDPKLIEGGGKAPLEICTGTYGGQSPYNLGRRHVPGAFYVSPPVLGAMGQGIHECIGTLRTYADGVVRNYPHRQVLALVEWACRKWPIDRQRVCINGQFAIWALRHPKVFAMVIADPFANYAAGIEMQKHGWQWGAYPQGSPNEDGGVDQWEYLNVARHVRQNPTRPLPFYVGKASSASHVGDMGFLPAPELYRALLDTRRAFAAHWGASQGFGGPPRAVCAMPIRRDRARPAFSHCSLDDMIGEGDQWGGAAGGTIGSGDPWGRFNAYLRWGFDDLVDESDRFEVTVWLAEPDARGRGGAPKDTCTVDLTPRNCRKFRARPGERFRWTRTTVADGKVVASGTVVADQWGLVTVEKIRVTKDRNRIRIWR